MADDRADRISRLSKRFTTHAVGRQKTSERNRERKSFYLDGDLVTRIDQTYRDINHALYPRRVSKSTFLETVIERGIEDRDELQALLAELSDSEDIPDE